MISHDEITKFNEWLISAGYLPGVNLVELWDQYEMAKGEPDVNAFISRKPRFKKERRDHDILKY